MAYAQELPTARREKLDQEIALGHEWRRLGRAATVLALLTAPAVFAFLVLVHGWPAGWALLTTLASVIVFRGLVDLLVHRLIPSPSLYGANEALREDDIVSRRRLWYWRTRLRRFSVLAVVLLGALALANLGLRLAGQPTPLFQTLSVLAPMVAQILPLLLTLGIQLPLLFFINFAILFGPLLFFGLKQMKGYEPGDADWGVRLQDVRGQAEPKEEVTRVISLWQAGEEFKKAGGKPERGLLFLGAPGTGKTMLSKGIATSFNCPFVTMPGSGFAQTFIGMDVIVVLFLIRKARRLAKKWGGQCIVFIDEIDAVGLRRQALQGGMSAGFAPSPAPEELCFFGPWGATTGSGDVITETRAWREKLFASRASAPAPLYPPAIQGAVTRLQGFIGGMGMGGGGGGMALNQLLIQMDGVDDPPWGRKFVTNRVNTFLDASYVVPRRVGKLPLRLKPPKPRPEQIYFIGATNVPIDRLDPALIRPGRMGRHIWFRTPTKDDRKDIFDLYLRKVAHLPDLDSEHRRDELARMTGGYSPAMIEQVCSMALTLAHTEGREAFDRSDVVEAMTTIETGTAQGIEYVPEETRATALHEAGHAAGSWLYQENMEATRLTIRKRGGSLGHFQQMEKEERFSTWRSEEMARLTMILAAMATEFHFYGENTNGVGGDIQGVTLLACAMVGFSGMAPERVSLDGRFEDEEAEEAMREKLMDRYERIGNQIIHRSSSGANVADPTVGVLGDRYKRELAAQIIGQAFVQAYNMVRQNREALERIAGELIERKELHGDDVVRLLERVELRKPDFDVLDPAAWPKL